MAKPVRPWSGGAPLLFLAIDAALESQGLGWSLLENVASGLQVIAVIRHMCIHRSGGWLLQK